MSDFKTYKTKCLKVDLASNKKNFVIKKLGSSRQKSLDKPQIKTGRIPYFPTRIGSAATTGSSECSDNAKTDDGSKNDTKLSDDQSSVYGKH